MEFVVSVADICLSVCFVCLSLFFCFACRSICLFHFICLSVCHSIHPSDLSFCLCLSSIVLSVILSLTVILSIYHFIYHFMYCSLCVLLKLCPEFGILALFSKFCSYGFPNCSFMNFYLF